MGHIENSQKGAEYHFHMDLSAPEAIADGFIPFSLSLQFTCNCLSFRDTPIEAQA